jgi:hypothetical protein
MNQAATKNQAPALIKGGFDKSNPYSVCCLLSQLKKQSNPIFSTQQKWGLASFFRQKKLPFPLKGNMSRGKGIFFGPCLS